jgi:dolichyl-phosphate-mannose--protein O-mannosyl transferase
MVSLILRILESELALYRDNGRAHGNDRIYENVPYVAMRMVPAMLGVATVPLSYLTLRALDCRATTALLASLFITFENGMVTQSRHILLDSPLIFFTALTVFLWCGFCNEDKYEPFTTSWWTWLTLTGLSLGAVVSCKWVGLFTIATIGLCTVYQLWNLLGDLRVPPRLFVRHFIARALCLIVVPILFYMAMFQIHFLILENSGDGDGFMSPEFQHTLGGRTMEDTYAGLSIISAPWLLADMTFQTFFSTPRSQFGTSTHRVVTCIHTHIPTPVAVNVRFMYFFLLNCLTPRLQNNKLPFILIATATMIGVSTTSRAIMTTHRHPSRISSQA